MIHAFIQFCYVQILQKGFEMLIFFVCIFSGDIEHAGDLQWTGQGSP